MQPQKKETETDAAILIDGIDPNTPVIPPSWVAHALAATPMMQALKNLYTEEGSPVEKLEVLSQTQEPNFLLSTFAPLTSYLKKGVRYDDHANVLNFYTEWFNKHKKDIEDEDALSFLKDFAAAFKNIMGRPLEHVPKYDVQNVEDRDLYENLIITQLRLHSMNLEYDDIEELIAATDSDDGLFWLKLTRIIGGNPARSERSSLKRTSLHVQTADKGLALLDQKYKGKTHAAANRILYYTALQDIEKTAECVQSFLSRFPRTIKKEKTRPDYILQFLERLPALTLFFRAKQLYGPFYFLIKTNQLELAEQWLSFARLVLKFCTYKTAQFGIFYAAGDYDRITEDIQKSPSLLKSKKIQQIHSNTLRAQGKFAEALLAWQASYEEEDALSDIPELKPGISHPEHRLTFLHRASQIINNVPQPEKPKGIAIVSTLNCLNSMAILAPVLRELKKQGYAVIHLSAGMMDNQKTGIDAADRLAGTIKPDINDGKVLLDWHIDWDNRIVECEGINFYQAIYERISIWNRRFYVDINDPLVKKQFSATLLSCDYVLRTCLRIHETLSRQNIPVVTMSGNAHVMPFAVFRDFALAKNDPNLKFVTVNIAYENYYSNLGSMFSGSMAVVDMTHHRNCRMPFLAIPARFEAWYKENKDNDIVKEKVKQLIQTDRSLTNNQSRPAVIERIIKAQKNGQKIICCFGKILCDLGVPYDGGPAHQDIGDWINHTVKTLSNDKNTLLVIKPHPHELRKQITRDLIDYFRDVLPETLADNVIFLGHNECNLSDLAPHLDLAVLWNGTSSLELTAMNVPVMMCAHFGRHDYPIPLIYPENRAQYETYLKAGKFPKPSEELKHKAIALLHYMGTKDVALPNQYSLRPVTNDYIGVPIWNSQQIEKLFEDGDPYITIAADRIVEGLKHEEQKRKGAK